MGWEVEDTGMQLRCRLITDQRLATQRSISMERHR